VRALTSCVRPDNVGHHNTRALEPGRRSLVGIANGVFHDIYIVAFEPEMTEAHTMLGCIIASMTCMEVGEQERRSADHRFLSWGATELFLSRTIPTTFLSKKTGTFSSLIQFLVFCRVPKKSK
jgi:hypothetical protein